MPCGGGIELKKLKSICPNSQLYKIGLGFSVTKTGGTRPYKLSYEDHHDFMGMEFEDQKSYMPEDVKINFQFDTRIVGELIEPKKK